MILLVLFILASAIHLLGEYLNDQGKEQYAVLGYFTKPLLMSLLLLFYLVSTSFVNWWLISALILAFIGDVSLLIQSLKQKSLWFITGLVSFLLGHIAYIVLFLTSSNFLGYKWWSIFLALPFVISAIIVQRILSSHTGKMTVAVTVYILVICLMGISTTFLWSVRSILAPLLVYLGAWLFAISDILNGYVRFVRVIKFKGTIIMSSYIFAQLLIVLGVLLF